MAVVVREERWGVGRFSEEARAPGELGAYERV
jgi:hypothetical protein